MKDLLRGHEGLKLMMHIAMLKRQAKNAALKHAKLCEHLDCGSNMAAIISTDVFAEAMKFNTAMDALSKVDRDCPTDRLPTGK